LGIYLTAMKEEGRVLVTVLDSGSGRVDAEEDLMFSDLLGPLNVGDESFEVSIGDIWPLNIACMLVGIDVWCVLA
jgi:hypothetical protein